LQDFSFIGAIVILTVIFVIGLIFFLDTSVDVFVLFIINIFKKLYEFLNNIYLEAFLIKIGKNLKSLRQKKNLSNLLKTRH